MPDLRPVVWNDFEHLKIDDDTGELYWREGPVVTETRLSLRWWVNVAAVITALSTLALAAASWIRLLGG